MSTIVDNSIINGLNNMLNEKIYNILVNISEKYDIDRQELLDCYLTVDIKPSTEQKVVKKKKIPKPVENICLAKKADGERCTRQKKTGSEYCGKHINSQKFGSVNDSMDEDKYIVTYSEIINGIEYLVDTNNIVYTNCNDKPEIVGKKNNEGKLVLINELNI